MFVMCSPVLTREAGKKSATGAAGPADAHDAWSCAARPAEECAAGQLVLMMHGLVLRGWVRNALGHLMLMMRGLGLRGC